jgi:two-component system sensor histidine kinase MprB
MTLRRPGVRGRLSLVAALAVALTAIAVSLASYLVTRHELRGQVDESLRERAALLRDRPPGPAGIAPGSRLAAALVGTSWQLVLPGGRILTDPGSGLELPVGEAEREIARGERGPTLSDATVQGQHLRILSLPAPAGTLLQLARPLEEVDRSLARLRRVLLVATLAAVALAALLGRAVARASLVPLGRLTETVEDVARTRDLTRRIEVARDDEIGRLAGRFNEMLAALEGALAAQRRLVADASHELRTPLTSLRTNVEVLSRAAGLPGEDRERLLADVRQQLEELTVLVDDVVELARGAEPDGSFEDVRLDLLVAAAVERARRHAPAVEFRTQLGESLVRGNAARLDRAIANLLDNAAKWSPPGGAVDVTVRGGTVTVRDRGPGIAPEDLPHVFDRFYRATSSRSMPGSGLGLAIVRQTAESHGGTASARNAEGGGAELRLELPGGS